MEFKNIQFSLHNERYTVNVADVTPKTTLLQYLRDFEHLKGTKYMCLEGGCGACIVSVTAKHPITKRNITFAVNSCLVSIYSCEGWKIHTVDGIGNKKIGYHPVQEVLADFNGTQCGFCSPGMVMNMYALYESNSDLTMKEVENSFGGNMCRCTGYRPILTAFKSLCKDADRAVLGTYPDIEDLNKCDKRSCQKTCRSNVCTTRKPSNTPHSTSSNIKWFKVFSINEIFDVLRENRNSSYQLVAGNTARGVYPDSYMRSDICIDITNVENLLNDAVLPDSFAIGANKTLNDTIRVFRRTSKIEGFSYLTKLADHIELVAHVPVRNIGTIAGNLSIKHEHNEFPSDIFLILETVGAKLTIVNSRKKESQWDILSYLTQDMNRKVIKTVKLPKLDKSYKYHSYKIMPRAQNAHAMVNAGFLLKFDNRHVIESARIVYGGISPTFFHAEKTEKYLIGKNIFENTTLQGAFEALNEEVLPDDVLPQASPEFRKKLAISLFYKFILSIAPDNKLSPENKSGGFQLQRPVSKGVQDYQTNESLYPLTQPIPKLDALGQTSGEVEYITDMSAFGEVYAAFVTAKAPANSVIIKIDPSKALERKGVLAFFEAKDIPGSNNFIPFNSNFPVGYFPGNMHIELEELFCSGTVRYYFQPVGIIVATTQELADQTVDLVDVTYSSGKHKPLLTIRQILAANATDRIVEEARLNATSKGQDIKHIIKGKYDTSWQYHYHMETQICLVVPKEDNFDIYPGTQWMDLIQTGVAAVLNIPENKINILVKRLGGAFGAKITRNGLVACAAALAAHKLQRPVKMRMSFSANMNVIGKRFPCVADYEVGVNDKGEIQYLDDTVYLDYGAGGNDVVLSKGFDSFYNSYKHDTWNVIGNNTRSDSHGGVWTRAPANNAVISIIESIMEHIAMEMNKSPLEIRLANMSETENKNLIRFINELRQWSDYDKRLKVIEEFNKTNRWIKKGLSLIPMTYPMRYIANYSSIVAIYAGDGSVVVSHGGIEVGQGINTKVAQVCAFALGIPLNLVSVKASNNFTSANNSVTAASVTSEVVCYATLKACEDLLSRMKPIKEKMKNPTWKELVKECQKEYVNLLATYMNSPNDPPQGYDVYGVCAAEVEVDILTGTHQINRVDLLEDTGDSMSPFIDIGQVEGAFIMGLGFWETERIVYDNDGQLLTNRTWNYKIPGALDIPVDFRVKFPRNNPNPKGILHSKATGEPALCLAVSIPIAIRHAVASARASADPTAQRWYPICGPSDVENTFINSLNDFKQYKL